MLTHTHTYMYSDKSIQVISLVIRSSILSLPTVSQFSLLVALFATKELDERIRIHAHIKTTMPIVLIDRFYKQ